MEFVIENKALFKQSKLKTYTLFFTFCGLLILIGAVHWPPRLLVIAVFLILITALQVVISTTRFIHSFIILLLAIAVTWWFYIQEGFIYFTSLILFALIYVFYKMILENRKQQTHEVLVMDQYTLKCLASRPKKFHTELYNPLSLYRTFALRDITHFELSKRGVYFKYLGKRYFIAGLEKSHVARFKVYLEQHFKSKVVYQII